MADWQREGREVGKGRVQDWGESGWSGWSGKEERGGEVTLTGLLP